MVKILCFRRATSLFAFTITLALTHSVNAFGIQPSNKGLNLNQKLVAELSLSQGYKTKEVNLQFQTYRLTVIQNMSIYDWTLGLDSGYQFDNSTNLISFGNTPFNNKYKQYKTNILLNKSLNTGTLLGLEYARNSQQSNIDSTFTTPPPDNQTFDNLGLTLEQNLWANYFGTADRAISNSVLNSFEAQNILRANNLEEVVLEAIRQYWTTYTAQENFKEAMSSRDRYKKLVDAVKRKTSLGYSNPGDLPQAQAEYESREQAVKSTSTSYLNNLSTFITLLKLDPNTEIEFDVEKNLPSVPKLPSKNIEELRSVRSQKYKVEAAKENLIASKSKSAPTLNLVGKIYSTGWGENSQDSYSAVISTSRPKYYIGFKLNYNFGSDIQNEDLINKKINADLEETHLKLQTLQALDIQIQSERKVHETYSLALSTEKQRIFREKAVQEINRSYSQGRTDISILITAMNNFVNAELAYIQAIGSYHIALNEWASVRDELIPESSQREL
jgi:outer membrane protein TolC